MGNDDRDADIKAFFEGDDPGEPDGQAVAKTALDIVARFGREAPLRAELAAQEALATGDVASYRLFKRVEGAADNLLFFQLPISATD
jgi:hypothetical protein